MESVGEFFRQVRETKGLTIDEVASKTRIRSDFVKALEDSNFAKLPDQVFARGFVRSYARSLGLDEEDAIQRFAESAGAFYEKQGERERLRQRQLEEDRRRRSNRKAVGIAIMAAVLTLIFLLSREQSSIMVRRSAPDTTSSRRAVAVKDSQETQPRTQPDTQPTSGAAKLPDPPPLTLKPQPEKAPVSTTAPVARKQDPLVSSASPAVGLSEGPLAGLSIEGPIRSDEPLVLDLEATELSWVVVQIDAGSPQEALLRPGEKAQWKAQDQFTVTLGNAGGIRAELNGKPQRPFGPSGKVVRDVVLKR